MKSSLQHYIDKVAPRGSSLYYSLLLTAKPERRTILTIHALAHELLQVVKTAREKSIAQTKLTWWQQEIGRLYAGKAEHPLTQALEQAIAQYALPEQLFNEFIEGCLIKLDTTHLCTEKDLHLYCYRNTGIILILTSLVLGNDQPETMAFAHDLGITLGVIELITDFRKAVLNHQVLFPRDDLTKYHVEAKQLSKLKMEINIKTMLEFQANRARKYYLTAQAMLPPKIKKQQRPLLILSKLAITLLEEIEKDNFSVFDYETRLTPFRKILIALRT